MRPVTYDPRAAEARARFRVRDFAPVVTIRRFAFGIYAAQAAIGFVIGFATPFFH